MKYKYLFSDLDGTLLNEHGHVSARNAQAVHEYIRAGGHFTIATGRTELISGPFLEELEINFPAILYNGSGVYDFEQECFLHRELLDISEVERLLKISYEVLPDLCVEGFSGGLVKLLNPAGIEDHIMVRDGQKYIRESFSREIEYMKLILYHRPEELVKLRAVLEASGLTQIEMMNSAPFYLEILPKNCTKGSALDWISRQFGIPREETAAIGDFENDIQMLRRAGLAAAPENALEEVKKEADLIVSSNQKDAVADLIDRIME